MVCAALQYVEAEKTNARWAMAGVAGIMGQVRPAQPLVACRARPRWFCSVCHTGAALHAIRSFAADCHSACLQL